MKVALSHPTGNANVRAVLSGLYASKGLSQFYTCVANYPNSLWDHMSRFKQFNDFKRRRFDAELRTITKSKPSRELGRLLASKIGLQPLVRHEKGIFSVDSVYDGLDKYVASQLNELAQKDTIGVYAYEDGALNSFKAAKERNLFSLYDLPIGYWRSARRLLEEEREKHPEWAMTLTSFKDSSAKLQKKEEELQLANHIFVASQFTASTLKDYPKQLAPIHIIPYGFPEVTKVAQKKTYNFHTSKRPLKLLFVGGLSQRKGISYLFEAVNALGDKVELTIVGKKTNSECKTLDKALARHNWISSLPHQKVLELMRTQDVLLFPSLFEGFGLVITEAMSQGTPVITTERTAGPDLITDGIDGWLIKAGSTASLKEKIEAILAQPLSVATAGKAAMERAKNRPWSAYGKEVAEAIRIITKAA